MTMAITFVYSENERMKVYEHSCISKMYVESKEVSEKVQMWGQHKGKGSTWILDLWMKLGKNDSSKILKSTLKSLLF